MGIDLDCVVLRYLETDQKGHGPGKSPERHSRLGRSMIQTVSNLQAKARVKTTGDEYCIRMIP